MISLNGDFHFLWPNKKKGFFNEPHSVFMLWCFEDLFKRSIMFQKQRVLILFLLFENLFFWEIQNNPDSSIWCPQNLLSCFWMCFKRLFKCVVDLNCPNFFIPENNVLTQTYSHTNRQTCIRAHQNKRYKQTDKACFLCHNIFCLLGANGIFSI